MDHYSPAGPGGGNLRHEYAIVAEGAVEAHTAAGPQRLQRLPGAAAVTDRSFTLESPTARCVLTVEVGDYVLARHWDRAGGLLLNPTATLYKGVWGFVVASGAGGSADDRLVVKIVHCPISYSASRKYGVNLLETAGIWRAREGDMPVQMLRDFYYWVEERGWATIEDKIEDDVQ
jgi:hypothetical protein